MLHRTRFLAVMLSAFLLVTVVVLGEDESECTVYVQPGESIQTAIDTAPVGAVICVGEGEWQEDLVIQKALTLKGAGSGKTIIHGTGEAIDVVAIYCLDAEPSADVHVQIGGFSITGEGSRAGIAVDTAIRTTVTGCSVQGNGFGFFLQGDSATEIRSCTLSANHGGVIGLDSAEATITGAVVSGNATVGIDFGHSAKATISDSSLSENGWAGVSLGGSAQASVSSTAIASNGRNGLLLKGTSQATFADCDVTENGFDYAEKGRHDTQAIGLDEEAEASFTSCTVSGNVTDGINLTGNAQAEIAESTISGNGRIGIWLFDTARATLDDCTISDHPSAGIDARDETSVEIEGCTISDNFEGVALWGSPYAVIEQSTIRRSQGQGVSARGTDGEIEGFAGYVTGWGNVVVDNAAPLPCNPCWPQYLCFLESEEGGELDKRE